MAARESAKFAQELIAACCEQQGIVPGQLTAHADRGSPMIAKSTAQLYFDLGVAKSHSRPRTSNDNPYSESNFRTIKYRPEMPGQFGSLEHARQVVRDLVDWYNEEHYHVGLALLHPVDVRYGRTDQIVEARQRVLDAAHHRHPERFVRGCPKQKAPPSGAWINPPAVDQIAYAARTQEVIPELDAHGQRWEIRLGHVVLGRDSTNVASAADSSCRRGDAARLRLSESGHRARGQLS